MKNKGYITFALCFIALISLVVAQDYLIDIKTDKQTYSSGENVTYNIILLKDRSVKVQDLVYVSISDINEKKTLFNGSVTSNKDNYFLIEKAFPSGNLKIGAFYQNKSVERIVFIGPRKGVEFSIQGDKLKIKNTGNVPYTETLYIVIGEKEITQKQDIEVGGEKEIKLVAPDGNYNIRVNDEINNSISMQDVHLTGTGLAIGALDEVIVQNQPLLGGTRDVNGESFFTSKNFSVAFIFIGAVFGLFVLIWVERAMHKKRSLQAREMVKLH